MPRQRPLRTEVPPVDTTVLTPIRPPVPAPAQLRDVDADAAAILAESVGRAVGRPVRATAGPVGDLPARPAGAPDAGMNTAEYAVGTLAAVAFAGLLLKVLTSDGVQAALAGVIQRALG